MGIIETRIDRHSPEFQENAHHFQQIIDQLSERIQLVQQGGGEDAIAKHRKRNKLLARERIQLLCDPNTPFLELSPLAAWDMYHNEAPSAGIVTGIGSAERQEWVSVGNGVAAQGGRYYPITGQQHSRAQENSDNNHLPFY